jgi:phosphatidylserine decarboxylase
MSASPIRYYDRYQKTLREEQIFGEKWLRFAYEHPVGPFFVWLLARRALFSKFYGWKMNKPESALRVLPFIAQYGLDVDEFAKSAFDYKTFNDFFYRALKPAARPIASGDEIAVLPADGRHLVYPDVDTADGFYVKGKKFTLAALLGSEELGARFSGGSLLISRLCPVDYHRFHFPIAGIPGESRLINGWLYSVSPLALRVNPGYLTENKRMVTLVDSPVFGQVAVLEIGATMVGAILQSFIPGRPVAKGDEKGLFAFGGSCVVTVFQRGRVRFDEDLILNSAVHREVYARMGDRLGVACGTHPSS